MKPLVALIVLLLTTPAQAGEQVRLYGADGRSLGTITTDTAGTSHYRDAQGHSIGTSSTDSSGVTTFYGDDTGSKATLRADLDWCGESGDGTSSRASHYS
jgi:hypothetical protein